MQTLGFIKIALCSPKVCLGNPKQNVENIISILKSLDDSTSIAVFPELCLTGVSLEDMFLRNSVLQDSLLALEQIANESKNHNKLILIGLPLALNSILLNVTALVYNGNILAFIPKKNLQKYDSRCFSTIKHDDSIFLFGNNIPIVSKPLLNCNYFTAIVSSELNCAYAGVGDIFIYTNAIPSTLNSTFSVNRDFASMSNLHKNALVYANTGYGESTSYATYDGSCIAYELGECIAFSNTYNDNNTILYASVDVSAIKYRKLCDKPYTDYSEYTSINIFDFNLHNINIDNIGRKYNTLPFLPSSNRDEYFSTTINILSTSLITRIRNINIDKIVLGFSGGLDSTVALLIAYYTFKKYNIDTYNIYAVTMPGFGTSKKSKDNSSMLINLLNISHLNIDITSSVLQHFNDIDYDHNLHDVTYENSQARERTQILMDLSNKLNAIVLGTGDLSESALGFCTYNGDHMSMYNINASLSKTLMREFAPYVALQLGNDICTAVNNIVNAPVSPELLPLKNGELQQKTEDILGNYELHDFFLYNMLYNGADRAKLFMLACLAFKDIYTEEYINNTLNIFIKRFFISQFKRNCSPDSPTLFDINLSAHKGLHMPSDVKVLI